MIFDSAEPPPNTEQDGTMTIEFEDCVSGEVTYDLGSTDRQGSFPISRLAVENVDVCEARYAGPGIPRAIVMRPCSPRV